MGKIADNIYYERAGDIILMAQRLRSCILLIIHKFFSTQDFIYIDPPILHEQIQGKAHEIYLPLYGNRYSLNSSNALYMGAYAALLGNVYAISPTFRDEQYSVNHLVEFRMLEAEILGMTYSELPDFVENLINYILKELLCSSFVQSSKVLSERINNLVNTFQPRRLTFEKLIQELGYSDSTKLAKGMDLSDIDVEISKYIKQPVFIMDYPRKLATWTAKPKNIANAFAINLILPDTFGELCEGCERTNNIKFIRYKMRCAKIKNLQWYITAISNITMPRCGFGIGVDRLLRWIAGLQDISNCVLFPRIKYE